jgi:hypothetical protein
MAKQNRLLTAEQAGPLADLIHAALTAKFAHGMAVADRDPGERKAAQRADEDAQAALWRGFYDLVDQGAIGSMGDRISRRMEGA